MFTMNPRMARRGFSLIELVIVVVIIGIIGAIAIPRMSRGAAGAGESALKGNLAVLRGAIDLYHTEHAGTYPAVSTFENQLTLFSNDAGATKSGKDAAYPYGPYLRAIPPLPVGTKKGKVGVAASTGASVAWIYDETTGTIVSDTAAETDSAGKLFNTY